MSMGVEIIPAILAKDEKEFRRRVEAVTGLCDSVQIDVMDGTFTSGTTFLNARHVDNRVIPMEFEVHLMVSDPVAMLDGWSRAGASRAVVHFETAEDPIEMLKEVRLFGMEAGLTFNPETPVKEIFEAVPSADFVQVMGVTPGAQGQPFQPIAIQNVRELRSAFPELVITVDGGVSVGTARALAEAGADRLIVGSAIFHDGAPAKALEALAADVDIE